MRWGIIAALVLWCGVGLAEDSVEEVKSKFAGNCHDTEDSIIQINILNLFPESDGGKLSTNWNMGSLRNHGGGEATLTKPC